VAFKIYTKTGDKGKTALIGGTRIPKNHIRIEAYGTVDELNSWLGYIKDIETDKVINNTLKEIQDRLFTIGSALACDPNKETKMLIPDLHEADVTLLEKEIDRMDEVLPMLKNFVIPGGNALASSTHIVRCICRKAERICVAMQEEDEVIAPLIIIYLNRLSDYLFTLARYMSHKNNSVETTWTPRM
jgi:cob(I)alamin adenosyltransferase